MSGVLNVSIGFRMAAALCLLLVLAAQSALAAADDAVSEPGVGQTDELDEASDLAALDALDELDAELETLDESGFRLNSARLSIAEELRVFPRERQAPGNSEQLLTEVELELDLNLAKGFSFYARPWLLLDALDTDLLRYEPLDAYLLYANSTLDIKLGQFVESWGVADASNPIDVLNRRDYATDFFDPQVRGELGVRARVGLAPEAEGTRVIGQPALSAYFMPLWRRTDFPTENSRFNLNFAGVQLAADDAQRPEFVDSTLSALRFDHTLNTPFINADLKYIGAHYPERVPTFGTSFNAAGELVPEYFGVWMLGGGLRAVPQADWWSKLTLKAEVVYKRPFELRGAPLTVMDTPDKYVQYVAGFDRTFASPLASSDQLTLTAEYMGENGADDPSSELRLFDNDVALRLFYELGDFARTSIELRAVVDLDDPEWLAEAVVQRQLRFVHEDLRLELAGRWVEAAPTSLLGRFANSSSVSTRLQFDW